MQRYFASTFNNQVILNKDDVFHLTKVMRVKSGDYIEIVDENHQPYLAVVVNVNPLVIEKQEPIIKNSELNKNVTLFFGLAKSDKVEFVIQKATELGASSVILFQGKRSVVKFSNEDFERKLPRFNAIAKEAAEQCHREIIPEIKFIKSINEVDKYMCDLNLFAYELSAGSTNGFDELIKSNPNSVSIIVGPEGGFDESEANYLDKLGFKRVSLGKRILRCETAAVYALSVLAFNIEK